MSQGNGIGGGKKEEKDIQERLTGDGEYVGNIWGWRFSRISLGIILFFLCLMLMRYYYLVQTGNYPVNAEETKTEQLDE